MEAVFEIYCVCAELGKMQEFCLFTENVHKIANYTDNDWEIEKFINELSKNVFSEELSYDERRKVFVQHSMENVTVFNAMFNLQRKGKENIKKIDLLIPNSNQVLQKQKEDSAEIRRLLSEKYQIQKKIDNLLQKISTEWLFFFVI